MESFYNDGYYINARFRTERKERTERESVEKSAERHNLLLNKNYIIRSIAPFDMSARNEISNTQPHSGLLTDGKYVPENGGLNSREYFHITIGVAREIIFDMEETCSVDSLCIGFGYYPYAGVTLPTNVTIGLSEDGEEWNAVVSETPKYIDSSEKQRIDFELGALYRARFIRLTLCVLSFIWIDQVEAYGYRDLRGKSLASPESEVYSVFPDNYPSLDVLDGTESIALVTNYVSETPEPVWSKEVFCPLVSYRDKKGVIRDSFFDSFLFLPKNLMLETGVCVYNLPEPTDMNYWTAYYNELFAEGRNLDALDKAVGEAAAESDGKISECGVFLPVLLISHKQKSFGDVDGDGVSEDCSDVTGRMKVLCWWTEKLINGLASGNFKHIKLRGFYWYEESVPYTDEIYAECLSAYSAYIHAMNYKLIWAPWYQAPGIGNWRDYGFDCVFMQPNYMWAPSSTILRLKTGIATSKMIGAGIQLEIHPLSVENDNYLRRYRDYLRECNEAGCSGTVNVFYQGKAPGEFFRSYVSSVPAYRSVYDDTYRYIKRKLAPNSFELKERAFNTLTNKPLRARLNIGKKHSDALYTVTGYPMNGNVRISSDGKFSYFPNRGFSGIDSFIVNISDTMSSQDETIIINIK